MLVTSKHGQKVAVLEKGIKKVDIAPFLLAATMTIQALVMTLVTSLHPTSLPTCPNTGMQLPSLKNKPNPIKNTLTIQIRQTAVIWFPQGIMFS